MTVRGVRWAAATANKRLWALVDAPPPVRRGALLTAVCGGGGDRPWRGCEELTAATAWRAVCAVCRLATPPHPPLSSTFPPPGGVAPLLLPRDGGPFAVGRCSADDYHPPANVAKMASGVGLDDADRQPWLATLAALLASLRAAAVAPAPASAPADGAAGGGGALPPPPPPAAVASLPTVPLVVGVLACSALKVAYRRALEGAPPAGGAPAVGTVVWVGLAAPAATLAARVTARRSASGDWMGASMVAGQLIDWERWTPGEGAGWEVTPGGGGGGGEGGVDAVVSSVMDTWQRWVEGVVEKGE